MTPARRREAERVADAFHAALIRLGITVQREMLTMYRQNVSPMPGTPGWQLFLPEAVARTMMRRREAREIAEAFYDLKRALLTGRAVMRRGESANVTTLDALRSRFNQRIGFDYTQGVPDIPAARDPSLEIGRPGDGGTFYEGTREALPDLADIAGDGTVDGEDAELIERDDLDGVDNILTEVDRQAEVEAYETTDQLGRQLQEERYREADELARRRRTREERRERADAARDWLQRMQEQERERQERERERNDIRDRSAVRVAASSTRIVENGARSYIDVASSRDRLIRGWIRVSSTGTPCGFCAMMMSRQVLTTSRQRAWGDHWHDNCMCIPIPVTRTERIEDNPRFDLNRYFSSMWPEVTRGYSGRDAIRVWRRWLRRQNREPSRRRVPTTQLMPGRQSA